MDCVPLRVRIGLDAEGKYQYPPFDTLSSDARMAMDWKVLVSITGGWHYDRRAPFGLSDAYSPNVREMFGLIFVPPLFAEEAMKKFPTRVDVLDDAAAGQYLLDRGHFNEPAEKIDQAVVGGLRAKYGVPTGVFTAEQKAAMTPEERAALDPEDGVPGIVRNPHRDWSLYKRVRQLRIDAGTVSKLRGGGL